MAKTEAISELEESFGNQSAGRELTMGEKVATLKRTHGRTLVTISRLLTVIEDALSRRELAPKDAVRAFAEISRALPTLREEVQVYEGMNDEPAEADVEQLGKIVDGLDLAKKELERRENAARKTIDVTPGERRLVPEQTADDRARKSARKHAVHGDEVPSDHDGRAA